jgi:hypothetical protein
MTVFVDDGLVVVSRVSEGGMGRGFVSFPRIGDFLPLPLFFFFSPEILEWLRLSFPRNCFS